MSGPSLFQRVMASTGRWLLGHATGRPAASYYRGASIGRLTDDFMPTAQAIDRILKSDLALLRERSRQFAEDNPHAKGFLRDLRINVIGVEDNGIPLQARVTMPDGKTMAREVNARIEAGWKAWGVPEYASTNGQDSWADQQNLYLTTLATDGEVLWRDRQGADNPFGYDVEILDAALLDEKYNRPPTAGGNEIRCGVELDPRGRPVAYHLWTAYPGEGRRRERVRIPATELHHDFVKWRVGQTRGIPWFAPVLFDWKMLDGYTEAAVVKARAEANSGGFFTATGDDAQMWADKGPGNPTDPAAAAGQEDRIVLESEPGLYRQLPPGLSFQPIEPTSPNSNQPAFQKVMLQWIARGLGPSYTSLSGDFENTNYSSGRMGLLPERDFYRSLARWVVVRFHRRVKARWLPMAMLAGAVRLPTEDAAAYGADRWLYRGWGWVDPLNDAQAKLLMRKMGLTSTQRLCAELGVDLEEILQEEAEAQQLAEEYGVDISGEDMAITPRQDGPAPGPAPAEDSTQRAPRRAAALRVMGAR